MSKIIVDPKKINLLTSALAIFTEDGRVIAIEKIPGFMCHIEYLKVLYKNDKEIKNTLSKMDLKYYMENPSEMLRDVMPIFSKSAAAVFLNMSPHITTPTNIAMMLLPETLSKKSRANINNMREKFNAISFLEIDSYNPEINYYDTILSDFSDEPNSEILFEIINDTKTKDTKRTK